MRGLDIAPSSDDLRSTLLSFLATNELSRLDRRLDAEQFFVVSRLLPGLLAAAPNGVRSEEDAASVFQRAFNAGTGIEAVEKAWNDLYDPQPVPTNLSELMKSAASDIPIEELASLVFESWHVDLPAWNEKAAEFCPEAGHVENMRADEMVANMQDRLVPVALALLRRHLDQSGSQQLYQEARERVEGDLYVPDDAKRTWSPSDRTLATPLAHAVAGTAPNDELPEWASRIIPVVGETCEDVVRRLGATGLKTREDEYEAFDSNLPAVKELLDKLQLFGLVRWAAEKGYGEVPAALYAKEPRQLIPRSQLLRLDSLLDFAANDDSAALEWSCKWWTLVELDSCVCKLPKASTIHDVEASWSITESNLEAAKKQRNDLRQTDSKNRRKIRLLSTDYMIPLEGGYPGLRKLIDDNLDPTFGEGLDPKKLQTLLKPSRSKGEAGRSPKVPGSPRITEQDEFVGAVGEYMVFSAIQKMTKNRRGVAAWKSRNRQLFIDDSDQGDDELGYDFRFRWKGQTYEIEVKSTKSKTPQQVQLGPTEVRRGQECVRKGKVIWQIWLVIDVLAAPAIHLLGNPYAADKQSDFVVDALGARVAFHLGYRR